MSRLLRVGFVGLQLVAFALGCLVFSAPSLAQTTTTGAVTGTVTDPSNAVIPKAKVTLSSSTQSYTLNSTSNSNGVFRFELLQPGPYTLTVSQTGFGTVSQKLVVQVGQVTPASVQLQLGKAVTTVTVTETVPLLQTDNGDTASTLTNKQIQNVPNPGNDESYIAQFAPGSQMNTQGGFGNSEVNGLGGTANLYTVNGMPNNDPFFNINNSGATNLMLGANDIQEATIVTNGYDASIGDQAGANINLISKAGGSAYHGNANYYWNGSALNANDWFNNARGSKRPFDNVNQWAASVGGPVFPHTRFNKKMFFFFDTEGIRILLPTSAAVNIPTPEFEVATLNNLTSLGLTKSIPFYCQTITITSSIGNFTCPSAPVGGVNQGEGIFNLYNAANGAANAKDVLPGLTTPSGIPTGHGCSDLSAPSASKFIGAGAIPCALQFNSTAGNSTHEWQVNTRVDVNLTDADHLFVQYEHDNGDQATYTDPINPIFNDHSLQPAYYGQMNWTHIFGPTMTNEMIISAAHYGAPFVNVNFAGAHAAFPSDMFLGDGSLAAIGGIDVAFPQGRNITQFGIADNWTKVLGRQTFKWGEDFRRYDMSDFNFPIGDIGTLVPITLDAFYNGGTGDVPAAGDFSVDSGHTFPRSVTQPFALYGLGGYIQDNIQVKSGLTLNLGLRIEHDSNPICRFVCFANIGGPFATANHNVNQPYNQSLQINQIRALTDLQNLLWMPRFGFAWQPFGSERSLVIRGGIGVFFDGPPNSLAENFAKNPPLDPAFTTFFDNLATGETTNLIGDAVTSNQAFQAGFTNGATLAQIQTADPFFAPPSLTTSDKKLHLPQVQRWSLGIQKGFGQGTMVGIEYVGDHSVFIPITNNSANSFGFATLPAAAPDARYGEVTAYTSAGIANYNGVTFTLRHEIHGAFGGGVIQAFYTYSHALDDVSNGGLFGFNGGTAGSILNPQNPNDFHNMYGNADYDARHSANINYVWDLPIRKALFGHGPSVLTNGWQLSGAVFTRTGFPYSVVDGTEAGALNSNNFFGPIFPAFLGGAVPSCGRRDAGPNFTSQCLKKTQFTAAGTETAFGPDGLRNHFFGPGYTDFDFSLMKNTSLHLPGPLENAQLGIGIQLFNAFNHVNFDQPINNISNGQFGTIQRAVSVPTSVLGSFLGGDASPRIGQIKATLTF